MEMLQKIIDCESLGDFPKNVYDEACFEKIASVQNVTLLLPELTADSFQNMFHKTIPRALPQRLPHVDSAR